MENEENSLKNTCRTCLTKTQLLQSVFDAQISDTQTIRLVDFVRKMTSIKIARGDGLPENICIDCIEKICKAYNFTRLCTSSDTALRLQYKQAPVINEAPENNSCTSTASENSSDSDEQRIDDLLLDSNDFEIIDEAKTVVQESLEVCRTKHKCNKCHRSFNTEDRLAKHQLLHDPNRPYGCQECMKTFIKKTHLNVHMRSHISTEDKQHLCPICGKTFTYPYLLKQHSFKHTEEKPFPCSICKKGCLTAESLRRHMKVHDAGYKKKQHVCSICFKEFPYPSFLAEHMKNHTGEKPFLCSTCGKGFRQSGALAYHIRSHTGYRPYKCQICSTNFTSRGVLRVHMRRHTDERPYVCDVCGMAFRQSTDMKSHRRTHTGDKRALCTVCGKRMSTTGQLTVHLRSHTGEKPFPCDICKKAFTTRTMLVKHKRIHTGEKPYTCNICGRSFNQSSTLKTHGITHRKNKLKEASEDDANGDSTKFLIFNIREDGQNVCVMRNEEVDLGQKNQGYSILPAAVPMI